MNEKIKELALKVGSIGDHLWLDGRDPDEERAVEKFAELIIRECTKKCDAISSFTHNKNPEAYEASTSIKHNILEHFGLDYERKD